MTLVNINFIPSSYQLFFIFKKNILNERHSRIYFPIYRDPVLGHFLSLQVYEFPEAEMHCLAYNTVISFSDILKKLDAI